jgi:tetratricopeptide (TPR) repeat protein
MKHWYFSILIFLFSLSASAQNAYFQYNKAYGQFLYQNYAEAVTLFTQVIAEKPDLADAYANRGISYHRLGQLDKAIEDYLKDNSLKKGRSSYNLACAYSLQGKKDEAFKLLEQCQKSEYKQLKSTLENDTDFEKIKTDARWKTLLASDFFTPYDKAMIEVNEKFGAKDYEGSIQACDKAIKINKVDKRGISSKAYLLSLLGKYDESIEEYDRLIQIDANDFEGYSGKANVYYQQRKYSQALPLYEMATSKNPNYLPFYETGMSKYAIGRKDDGISDMKKYCEVYPKDDLTIYTCGRLLYDMQRDSEALPYAEKAIELNQSVPEYYMLRGYINHVKKNWDQAIADYSQVISIKGNGIGEAYYKRGLCKAERYAVTKSASDKKGFCSDLESADAKGIAEAAQYLRELCE